MSKRKDGYKESCKTYIIGGKKTVKHFYYKTTSELADKIAQFESEIEQREKLTFKEVAEKWEEEHFSEIECGTQLSYTPALHRSIDALGDKEIKDITSLDIKRILDRMAKEKYAAQTVRIQRIVLNLIFKYAVLNEYVDNNPVTVVSVPRNLHTSVREIPSDKDIQTVMNSADEPFGMFAYLILFTGCRRGEALAIQKKYIKFNENKIKICQSVGYNGADQNKPVLSLHTKTKAGEREVIMINCLKNRLKDYCKDMKPDDFIFSGESVPPTKSSYRRRWERYLNITGLEITPHQLRHAYATILYDAGIDEKMTQTLMGHSNIQITRNIYTHIRTDRKKEAEENLNKYINQKMNKNIKNGAV